MRPSSWLSFLLATVAFGKPAIKGTTVLGIDLGSQLMKVAMVLPNEEEALQILYSDLSDRKTPMVVGFRRGKLLVGAHAQKAAISDPETTYYLLPSMLLGQCPAPQQALYSSVYASKLQADSRGQLEGGQALPMEHLLAQLLSGLVQHAEQTTSRSVGGVVITVPVGASNSLRQSIQDAASMARVPLLGLVHAPAAAALYLGAISKAAPADQVTQHIIYDAGASGCSATLVALSTLNNQPHIEVRGMARVDAQGKEHILSAWEIDRRAAHIIAQKWASRHPKAPAIKPGRALNRLMAEAQRVKQVLSANTETVATIEEFHGDLTLSEPVTRAELEAACVELKGQVAEPISLLLAQTGISLDEVASVLPVGGNSRVPWVQTALREAVGEQRMAYRLDADESMAMGAALLAAHWHPTLRVRPVSFKDALPLSLTLHFREILPGQNEEEEKQVTVIKGPVAMIDQRRAVAFKHVDAEVEWRLVNGQEILYSGKLGGAAQVMPSDLNSSNAKLKMWLSIDRLGMVRLEPAQLSIEQVADTAAAAAGDGKNTTVVTAKGKPKLIPLPVWEIQRGKGSATPLDQQLIEKLQRQMDEERAIAQKQRERAALRNSIEATIFRHRNLASDSGIGLWLSEAERKEMQSVAEKVDSELQDDIAGMEGEDERLAAWWKRLEAGESKANGRQSQWESRPLAMDQLSQLIADARRWLGEQRALPQEDRGATNEDLDQLQGEVDGAETQLQLARGWHGNLNNRSLDPTVKNTQLDQNRLSLRMSLTTLKLKKAPKKEESAASQTDEAAPQETPVPEATEEKAKDAAMEEKAEDSPKKESPVVEEKEEEYDFDHVEL